MRPADQHNSLKMIVGQEVRPIQASKINDETVIDKEAEYLAY